MWHLRTWYSGELGCVRLTVESDGISGRFPPKWFYKNCPWIPCQMFLLPCFLHCLHYKFLAQVPEAPGPAGFISERLILFKLSSFNLFLLQSALNLSILLSSSHPPVLQHSSSLLFLPNHLIPSQYQNNCSAHLISLLSWSLGPPSTGFQVAQPSFLNTLS